MGNFRIFETVRFLKDLDEDFSGQRERIRTKLTIYIYPQLRENPYFGKNIKKLTNYKPPTWRYRIGKWRFFYEIDEQKKIVFMVAADNRQSAY